MDAEPFYQFVPLDAHEQAQWDDLIVNYAGAELFHHSSWLDYLTASRHIKIRHWSICDHGNTIGYFCGGILRKAFFTILGSPLKGWGTNYMGPVTEPGIDQNKLLEGLDELATHENLALIELENRLLNEQIMKANGYEVAEGWTYIVTLSPENSDDMWKRLNSKRRNRIRKAIKSGLTVEDVQDSSLADEFFDQFIDVMTRKSLAPPYPREHPRLLLQHLKRSDQLFALRVRDKTGRVLATGLFPHDGNTVYFWGGASWHCGRELCPNDLMHWQLMCLAAERNLHEYNMSGNGRFKKEFGGTLVALKRWRKFYKRSARWARRGYELYFQQRIRAQALWRRLIRRPEGI